jgi:hypothetical protein
MARENKQGNGTNTTEDMFTSHPTDFVVAKHSKQMLLQTERMESKWANGS